MPGLSVIHVREISLYYLPIQTRVPLKFGAETVTRVTCARARVIIADGQKRTAEGWGETPLSVQWVWPSVIPFADRERAVMAFTEVVAQAWIKFEGFQHALEGGHRFLEDVLPALLRQFNQDHRPGVEPLPHLAALLCASVLDQALHDAYGKSAAAAHLRNVNGPPFLDRDLSQFLNPAEKSGVSFQGKFPSDFLNPNPSRQLLAWHLVGGVDALEFGDSASEDPRDGHPFFLADWIKRDGIRCLKIKLRGNDSKWDYERMCRVGEIGIANGVDWLTADFNCTVKEASYVNEILDRLRIEFPRLYGMLLYVEQPFPYDLEEHRIDTHSLSSRKPLFLDESAHDWRMIRRGRELGWNGVALKTCKTQTGAILSACWAKAHGMALMVQDLTNPMLAMIPHVLLAAHVGTLMGIETNCSQYYPEASEPEAKIHPGLYRRRNGQLDWSSLRGPGFGSRTSEIQRSLPKPAGVWQR